MVMLFRIFVQLSVEPLANSVFTNKKNRFDQFTHFYRIREVGGSGRPLPFISEQMT